MPLESPTAQAATTLRASGACHALTRTDATGGASLKLFDRDIVPDWLAFRPNEAVKTLDGLRIYPGPLPDVPSFDYDVLLAHVKLSVRQIARKDSWAQASGLRSIPTSCGQSI